MTREQLADALLGDGRQVLEGLRAKAARARVASCDASRARALQRLAAERAGLATITPAVPAGQLGRTACASSIGPPLFQRRCQRQSQRSVFGGAASPRRPVPWRCAGEHGGPLAAAVAVRHGGEP